jgi:hypothetical protein
MTNLNYLPLPDYVNPRDNPTAIGIRPDEVNELHLKVGAMCLRVNYLDGFTVKFMAFARKMALEAKQCMTESFIYYNPEDPPIKKAVDFNNKLKIAILATGWKPSEYLSRLTPDTAAKLKELEGKIITSPSNPESDRTDTASNQDDSLLYTSSQQP